MERKTSRDANERVFATEDVLETSKTEERLRQVRNETAANGYSTVDVVWTKLATSSE